MMLPTERSLWYYIGPGYGHSRIHMVVLVDEFETVTIPFAQDMRGMDWSWLGPTEDFPKFFRFCNGPMIKRTRS